MYNILRILSYFILGSSILYSIFFSITIIPTWLVLILIPSCFIVSVDLVSNKC